MKWNALPESRRSVHDTFNALTGEMEGFDFLNPFICHGKGSSGGGGTNTVETNSAPPPQVTAAYQTALNAAQSAASQPLQQYNGATIAGFTPDQQSAFGTIDQAQGIQTPYINQAQSALTAGQAPLWNGVQQFSPSAVQQYASPYTQNVLNTTMASEQNQDAQQQAALQGNTISSGAWGGDRAGVASAVLSGQQALANNATNANIENTGYSNALGEFNTQQQSQLGANEANAYLNEQAGFGLAGLGTEAQNTALQGASSQLQSGALQQQLGQEALNVPYEQFQAQQAYPYQSAQYFANIAEGVGSGSGGTSSSTSPTASVASQLGGLGLGGLGLYGALNSAGAFSGASAASSGVIGSAAGDLFDAALKRGGSVKGYDNGGGVSDIAPDVSVSYIPSTQSGHNGSGPPRAPNPYQDENPEQQGMQLLQASNGIGKILQGPSSSSSGFTRGGLAHFDDGGQVGGQSPMMAQTSVTSPNTQVSQSSYQNMTPEQLQQVVQRLPPGSAQAKQATAVLQQKRTMPNVGVQPTGGFGAQAPQIDAAQPVMARGGIAHYDDGGGIPLPPDPDQASREADLQSEINPSSTIPPMNASALTGTGASQPIGGFGTQTKSTPPSADGPKMNTRAPASANPWLSLAAAGFGMAAGTSPQAGVNIGRGALEGIQNYAGQQKEADTVNEAADRLMQEAKQHKDQLGIEQQQRDLQQQQINQTGAYQQGQLKNDAAGRAIEQAKLGLMQNQFKQGELIKDSFGNVTGRFDPTTNRVVPIEGSMSGLSPVNGAAVSSDTPQTNPAIAAQINALPPDAQDRLNQVAKNPRDQALILGVLQGRIPPNKQTLGSNPQAYLSAAAEVDPTFDAANPAQRMRTAVDYSPAGKSGQQLTALENTSRHAAATALAGIDLNNGSSSWDPFQTTINDQENKYQAGRGDPRLGNYNSFLGNYGHEAMKVISNKTNPGEAETAEFMKPMASSGSPAEILGALSAKNEMALAVANDKQEAYDKAMGPYGRQQQLVTPQAQQAFGDIDTLAQAAKEGTLTSPVALAARQRLQKWAQPVMGNASGAASIAAAPPMQGAKQAPDGNWYVPDPNRAGKYLQVGQ